MKSGKSLVGVVMCRQATRAVLTAWCQERAAARALLTAWCQGLGVRVSEAPGEGDPNKIDLDETMIVINTEFGRTPHRQGMDGLNHWPQGYVTVLMGGPVDAAAQGVSGSIDPATASADRFTTPAELRASLLDALGIYPFDAAAFGLGDLQGAPADDVTAITALRRTVLGVET